MLERLLAEIRRGGTFETRELAARLGTTPELVSAMLAHLQRLGQVRLHQTCASACAGCSLKDGCLGTPALDPAALYTLTTPV